MARLAEVLIDEGKFEKAEKTMDLALRKSPIDYFGITVSHALCRWLLPHWKA